MNFIKEVKVKSLSHVRLCDPVDCSPPGSSVHGISQARIQEWVAISFSRGSSWPRDPTHVSCTASGLFTVWATREAQRSGQCYNWGCHKFHPEKNLPWIQLSWPDKSAVHASYSLWRDTNLQWSGPPPLSNTEALRQGHPGRFLGFVKPW